MGHIKWDRLLCQDLYIAVVMDYKAFRLDPHRLHQTLDTTTVETV